MSLTQQKVLAASELVQRALQIKKQSSISGGMRDLMDWLEHDAEKAVVLLDEVYTELDPEYPDQQSALNAEFEEGPEWMQKRFEHLSGKQIVKT